ncbi:hypothetical protein ZIOFF_067115 [Zingiber officinale]|uniref:Uncharacterized protein n=2 Tax=Zingiber officinale TaxID=94328 RepID=A0A8J5C5W0_ZINOF|nr:hypothetical protein ZIOFF_067115 [Zingiber officinale]
MRGGFLHHGRGEGRGQRARGGAHDLHRHKDFRGLRPAGGADASGIADARLDRTIPNPPRPRRLPPHLQAQPEPRRGHLRGAGPMMLEQNDILPYTELETSPANTLMMIQETSSAQYILQQYIAASGSFKLLSSIRNAYSMGKVRMVAIELRRQPGSPKTGTKQGMLSLPEVLNSLPKPRVWASGKRTQPAVFWDRKNQNHQREYSIKSFALVLHPATASCFSRLIENVERIMASVKKASVLVAASVGAVEALKDQAGLCRWNYALRSLQQHAKSNMRSLSQAVRMSSAVSDGRSSERAKQSEESLRKVMYLSCWGPN